MTVTAPRSPAHAAPTRSPVTGEAVGGHRPPFTAATRGSAAFRRDHGVRLAYVAGAMYKGVASAEMVERMGRSGLLGYYGSGGVRPDRLAAVLDRLGRSLGPERPWGCNLLASPDDPAAEERVVDLLLARGVRRVEAAAFVQVTPALVRYRPAGARLDGGRPVVPNRVLGKASRPEVAEAFLAPPPAAVVDALLARGALGPEEAAVAPRVTMADDLCAEAAGAGHPSPSPSMPTRSRGRLTTIELAAKSPPTRRTRVTASSA